MRGVAWVCSIAIESHCRGRWIVYVQRCASPAMVEVVCLSKKQAHIEVGSGSGMAVSRVKGWQLERRRVRGEVGALGEAFLSNPSTPPMKHSLSDPCYTSDGSGNRGMMLTMRLHSSRSLIILTWLACVDSCATMMVILILNSQSGDLISLSLHH